VELINFDLKDVVAILHKNSSLWLSWTEFKEGGILASDDKCSFAFCDAKMNPAMFEQVHYILMCVEDIPSTIAKG
jgi:hypothetical protein